MSRALRIISGTFGRVALLDMDRSLVRHAHPHCHVLLKIAGDDTRFSVGSRNVSLTDRLTVLVNAWEPHAYVHDTSRPNALILALYIEPRWLRLFRANWLASSNAGFFMHPTGEVSDHIVQLSHALSDSMLHGGVNPLGQEQLLSALMIAVVERFSPWRTIGTQAGPASGVRLMDFRVRRTVEAIRSDPANYPGVEKLARIAGLSRAHFFALFEASTGMTPHVFLNAIRIEGSVGAVTSSDTGLAQIGRSYGFKSSAHFNRFFRDHVSVAPGAFRSSLQPAA